MSDKTNYLKMKQSTIERCVYPDCKESIIRTSRTIFLPPCYAADGTARSYKCFTNLYGSNANSAVPEDDIASLDADGQRLTTSRQ
jgi:hypothetical protein